MPFPQTGKGRRLQPPLLNPPVTLPPNTSAAEAPWKSGASAPRKSAQNKQGFSPRVPEGRPTIARRFQRRVRRNMETRPGGTAEPLISAQLSRPSGSVQPAAEAAGYYQRPLRDHTATTHRSRAKHSTKQPPGGGRMQPTACPERSRKRASRDKQDLQAPKGRKIQDSKEPP